MRGLGASVEAVQADLATHDGVERLYERVTAGGRPLSAVAINAGIGAGGPFAETDLAGDLEVVDLNVRSAVHLAKLCLRDMAPRREGRALFTSFLLSFAEALRNELKDTGVTVTALMPGATDTEFFERAGMEDTRVGSGRKDDGRRGQGHAREGQGRGAPPDGRTGLRRPLSGPSRPAL
ncbi:SDR family NAD(P)-dependent oxidoreductase [Nonomuraea wenchangensis]